MNSMQENNWKEQFMNNYQEILDHNRAQKEESLERLHELLNTHPYENDNALLIGEDGFIVND